MPFAVTLLPVFLVDGTWNVPTTLTFVGCVAPGYVADLADSFFLFSSWLADGNGNYGSLQVADEITYVTAILRESFS